MLLYACEPNISPPSTAAATIVEAQQLPVGKNGLLLEETLLDEMMLPIGTKVIQDDSDPAQIEFELPDGYAFLTLDDATGVTVTAMRGGYSCSCSGSSGSCTTIYTEQGGFGCLHGNCSGSCTGKPTTNNELNSGNTIVGVINSNNDILTAKKVAYQASFSPGGLDAFFELEEVVQEIKEHYEFVYRYMEQPHFNKIEADSQAPEGYAFVPVTLYGVSFALIVPDDGSITTFFPDVQLTRANSCTGNGGCGCEYERRCKFGYCIYTCSGCSTCTLTIN